MATTETKALDEIIASRRAMILGGSALAGLMLAGTKAANATVASGATFGDTDILNFALNLEYLEANFYYLAAFGTTIDVQNAASKLAGAPVVGIGAGTATTGNTVTLVKASPKVPFTTLQVSSYAVETAIEEAKHVSFLRSALGSLAVAQPVLDLSGGATFGPKAAWNALASAATIGPVFDPFMSDANFLIGAYVFEDVGVTAYHGAAPLISTSTTGKTYLGAAASILAVEAYHAGLIRTSINAMDPTNTLGLQGYTNLISNLRSTLSLAANGGKNAAGGTTPDDFGLANKTVTLDNGATVPATDLIDADTNVVAFSRTVNQVLNIVTGGGAQAAGTSKGIFFPNGLNGLFA